MTLGLAGIGTAAAAATASALDINYLLSDTLYTTRTMIFGLFFLLGAALAFRSDWLEKFTTIHWPCWCAAAVACTSLAVAEAWDEPAYKLLAFFLTPIAGVLSAHVLLSGARRWFNRSTALTAKLVEASMTVYLFHSLFICWGAVAFLETSWNPLVEFGVIVAASIIASLGVHATVRRNWALLFLFNGTSAKRTRSPSLAEVAPVNSAG